MAHIDCTKSQTIYYYILTNLQTHKLSTNFQKESMNVYLEFFKKVLKVFNSSKYQYTKALKDSGYTDYKLMFNGTSNKHAKRKSQINIIWFNLPFSRAVSTNVGKRFLQLLRHFPPSNKLHKTFNKNTVKVSYCCTQNLVSIIKSQIKS